MDFEADWATVLDSTSLGLAFSPRLPLVVMKLKQQPEDFQVEEMSTATPGTQGPFAFYRLEKTGWSTPDALAAVRQRWRIDLGQLSCGGLKDRHARTVQYLTIYRGPHRKLNHSGIHVEYLGQLPHAYGAGDFQVNRFRLVLRDLGPEDVQHARQVALEVQADGLANYFDDQRFGSVGDRGEFIALLLIHGRFEQALRLALAAPYEHDRGPQKKEKAILRAHWGNWPACLEKLPRGHARAVVDYLLHHPQDYRGAVARLRPELRGLYLSAYQSHLWNRMLARWLRQHCPAEQLVSVALQLAPVPMPRGLTADLQHEWAELQLPLPSARLRLDPADPRLEIVHAVLAEEGLELKQMQIKGIRELFFSKGERAAHCRPADLECVDEDDELHPGRRKLILSFDLPRGSYATLLVKRMFSLAPAEEQPASQDRGEGGWG